MDILTSIHGKRFGLGKDGSLILNHEGNQRIIRGGGNIVNCTASTLTVTADLHAGKIITLNRAAGIVVSLPAATATGNVYKFFVGTTVTSNVYRINALTTDIIQGGVSVSTDAGGVSILAIPTADYITMNGSTTGGLRGSIVELQDILPNVWAVRGSLVSTGAEATPFSAAV